MLSEQATPQSQVLMHWWQSRAFLGLVERLDKFTLQRHSSDRLDPRVAALSAPEPAQSLPDFLVKHISCPKCGALDKSAIQPFEGSYFSDLFGFIGHALMACSLAGRDCKLDECSACQLPMQLLFADYHSRAFDLQKDLVARCFYNGSGAYDMTYGLLWFAADGQYAIIARDQLGDRESCAQLLERAVMLLHANERAWALAVIDKAINLYPADPLLMECVRLLDRDNERAVVDCIVSAHLTRHPDDASAHYWKSKLFIQSYLEALGSTQLLGQASEHLNTALSKSQGWKEAELLDCLISRLNNEDNDILGAKYEELLRQYPDFADLYYDYALFAMESNPSEALHLFAQGAALQPDDPEYIIGKARALLKMGKKSEADNELAKAKRMDEKHPGVLKAAYSFPLKQQIS